MDLASASYLLLKHSAFFLILKTWSYKAETGICGKHKNGMFNGQINLDPHKFSLYLVPYTAFHAIFCPEDCEKKEWKMLYSKSRKERMRFVTKQLTSLRFLRTFLCQISSGRFLDLFVSIRLHACCYPRSLAIETIKSVFLNRNFLCRSLDLLFRIFVQIGILHMNYWSTFW